MSVDLNDCSIRFMDERACWLIYFRFLSTVDVDMSLYKCKWFELYQSLDLPQLWQNYWQLACT